MHAFKHNKHYFVLTVRDASHHSQSCQISQMVSNLARANLCAAQNTSPWQGSQSSSSEMKTTPCLGHKRPELVWLKIYSRVTSVANQAPVIAATLPVSFDCGFSVNVGFLHSTLVHLCFGGGVWDCTLHTSWFIGVPYWHLINSLCTIHES